MENQLTVTSPEGSYPIVIADHLLTTLGERAGEFGLKQRTAIVCDEVVGPLYGRVVAEQLDDAALIIIPAGEEHKTLDTVRHLYTEFVAAGLDRSSTVAALGGGVVGDTAGFAAASYMRGLRFVQIPTTLLAMVDSSVGGKVGVDLPQGKNLVGAFKQPDAVLVDPQVLVTLPERQQSCGMAEIIKHGLIGDAGLLDDVERLLAGRHALDDRMMNPLSYFEAVGAIVQRAVQVKIRIVEADPFEHGIRAWLNLGHTFAHAIEQVSGYQWLHGEAVGAGLVAAARLSERLGIAQQALAADVERRVRTAGLPTRIGDLDPEALYAAMATDKKWRSGRSRFILLEAVERPRIVEGVPPEDVMAVLSQLRG